MTVPAEHSFGHTASGEYEVAEGGQLAIEGRLFVLGGGSQQVSSGLALRSFH